MLFKGQPYSYLGLLTPTLINIKGINNQKVVSYHCQTLKYEYCTFTPVGEWHLAYCPEPSGTSCFFPDFLRPFLGTSHVGSPNYWAPKMTGTVGASTKLFQLCGQHLIWLGPYWLWSLHIFHFRTNFSWIYFFGLNSKIKLTSLCFASNYCLLHLHFFPQKAI